MSEDDVIAMNLLLQERALPQIPEPLPSPVIDSHTHFGTTNEYSGLPVLESLTAARDVNVTRFVDVGCDVPSSRHAEELAQVYPNIIAAVGIHPNDSARLGDMLDLQLRVIDTLAQAGSHVRAIGETGLDYYRTRDPEGHHWQHESFRKHIDMAKKYDKTLVIHDRDAHEDILAIVDEVGAPARVVMHCFSGDAVFARQCLDRGFWLSFPGTITFKNADNIREAFSITPSDRILTETDAPFLTPVPQRGKPNAPYLLPHTVRYMAKQRGVALKDFCRLLSLNTEMAFGGPWGER